MIDLEAQQPLDDLPGLPGDRITKVGVDGGSGNVAVAEKLLDNTQVHPRFEKMSRV